MVWGVREGEEVVVVVDILGFPWVRGARVAVRVVARRRLAVERGRGRRRRGLVRGGMEWWGLRAVSFACIGLLWCVVFV